MKTTKNSVNMPQIARVAIRTSKIRDKDKRGETQEERRKNMEDALSPQTQLELARSYCVANGFILDEEASLRLADLDVSGWKVPWRKRPCLTHHLEEAKSGEFQHLLFYKATRAGRNLRDSLDLMDTFEEHKAVVHGIKENINSSTPSGRLMRNILLSIAEHQAEEISENIQDAILTRAKRGDITGRILLIWLKNDGNGGIEVIPEMKFAMRRMVELRMSGLGYRKITQTMNSEGLRTINGKPWREGAIYKYLTPSYIDSMTGTAFLNREEDVDDPRRVVIPGKFPPILSDDEADALRLVQSRNKAAPMTSHIQGAGTWQANLARVPREGRYRADSKYLLAGLIFCPFCGGRLLSMQHGKDRKNTRAYFCPQASSFPEGHPSGGLSICADSLEDGVLRTVRLALKEPPAPPVKRVSPKRMMRGVEQVELEMDKLVDLRVKDLIQESAYRRKYEALRIELEQLQLAASDALAPSARDAATEIIGQTETITQAQLRQLVLLLVARVEAPLTFPGVHVREKNTGLRRHALVTLNIENVDGVKTWLASLYLPRYQGAKSAPVPANSLVQK